jgi:hypothetical protein
MFLLDFFVESYIFLYIPVMLAIRSVTQSTRNDVCSLRKLTSTIFPTRIGNFLSLSVFLSEKELCLWGLSTCSYKHKSRDTNDDIFLRQYILCKVYLNEEEEEEEG